MRHDSRNRPRPDRSKPPDRDPQRLVLAALAVCLLGLSLWILTQPVVRLALLVALAIATMLVVVPLVLIRTAVALVGRLEQARNRVHHRLAQDTPDRTEPDRSDASASEQ